MNVATSGVTPDQIDLLRSRTKKLRIWLLVFIAAWLGGLVSFLFFMDRKDEPYGAIGGVMLLASIIPYIATIVYSYMIQKQLNDLKLYKPGAWQVIVAAIILNPFCIGFLIPVSVVLTVNKIKKQLLQQGITI